jgi:hypothetical protein
MSTSVRHLNRQAQRPNVRHVIVRQREPFVVEQRIHHVFSITSGWYATPGAPGNQLRGAALFHSADRCASRIEQGLFDRARPVTG